MPGALHSGEWLPSGVPRMSVAWPVREGFGESGQDHPWFSDFPHNKWERTLEGPHRGMRPSRKKGSERQKCFPRARFPLGRDEGLCRQSPGAHVALLPMLPMPCKTCPKEKPDGSRPAPEPERPAGACWMPGVPGGRCRHQAASAMR
jgi:hypothetical protein